MKPKEYLLKHGHISEIGRGRLSAAHIAIIKEAVAKGENIEGYSVSTAPATSAKPAAEVTREARSDSIMDVPDESRPEKEWSAYRFEDGKQVPVGIRTVCNNCGSSLSYCHDRKPVVWVDHETEAVVYFKPRSQSDGK